MLSRLTVSPNRRFLVHADGSPFFWLGDTAWELFHRLTREEADFYLQKRAGQGFTVIQAVVLAELDGLRVPNAHGEIPLEHLDPTQPREAYFRHVDWVIRRAAELGLYVGLLPTWGDKVNQRYDWAKGPEIFNETNARAYGKFLGTRYRDPVQQPLRHYESQTRTRLPLHDSLPRRRPPLPGPPRRHGRH